MEVKNTKTVIVWKGGIIMKTWMNPEVAELDMECTEYGNKYSQSYDEVRVDQNGNYWFSYSAGEAVPSPTGEVIKK